MSGELVRRQDNQPAPRPNWATQAQLRRQEGYHQLRMARIKHQAQEEAAVMASGLQLADGVVRGLTRLDAAVTEASQDKPGLEMVLRDFQIDVGMALKRRTISYIEES